MSHEIVKHDKEREEKAVMYHDAIIDSVKGINRNMRIMIISAREVKEKKLYIELGYDSFNSYLSSPEISVKPATMEKYIKIYEETVLKEKLTADEFEKVPISKLELIAPLKNPSGWVNRAKSLSYTDLRKEILEKIHGIKNDDIEKYSNKVENENKLCPHWNAIDRRCCAGVNIKEVVN